MKHSGFSLVELLVVIAIIGTLVSLVVPNYLSARHRAYDSRRKSDMGQLKSALRLYYNDFSTYPAILSSCSATVDFASGVGCTNVFMKKFPTEFGTNIVYYQGANGDDFCLATTLDNKSDQDIAASQSRCGTVCGANCNSTGKYCVCAD